MFGFWGVCVSHKHETVGNLGCFVLASTSGTLEVHISDSFMRSSLKKKNVVELHPGNRVI